MTYVLPSVPTVDQVMVEARASSFTKRSIKKAAKRQALELIVRMIDLTTLEGMDTPDKVRRLCRKGRDPHRGRVPSRRDRPCHEDGEMLRSSLHLINSRFVQDALASPEFNRR